MRLFALLALSLTAAAAATTTVQVLATTDLHANLMPWDYYSAKPANRGLARLGTIVTQERTANPNTLLIDVGDTIQGSPLASVYQRDRKAGKAAEDPTILAMNALGYASMTVGNHEFNFGPDALEGARRLSKFPWLSANTEGGPFEPFMVRNIAGVRVAVLGLTTPVIPSWEKPENYKGLTWADPVATAQRLVPELRARHKADILVVAAHAGFNGGLEGENFVERLAREVPGIDAVVYGHSHREVEAQEVNGALLVQPKNWGASLARLRFEMTKENGRWKVARRDSTLLRPTDATPMHVGLLRIIEPYHNATEEWLSSPVTTGPVALSARTARIEDTALIDAIQNAQMHFAKADVSFTAAFHTDLTVPAGPVTVRQMAALYVYDNELFAVEGTGRIVREALENAARFFSDKSMAGFNYDMAQGVTYEIDVSRPAGDRIRNLMFRGAPLRDDQPLRIALNNYRAAGSAGYGMFRDAKVVWRSYEDIRDLLVRYYADRPLPAAPDNNWRIVPETALEALKKETAE